MYICTSFVRVIAEHSGKGWVSPPVQSDDGRKRAADEQRFHGDAAFGLGGVAQGDEPGDAGGHGAEGEVGGVAAGGLAQEPNGGASRSQGR